jgi:hypothetical protein
VWVICRNAALLKDVFLCIHISVFVAAFILISIAIYASKPNEQLQNQVDFSYHSAFAFSIIGMIAAIAAGITMLVDMKRS